MAAPTEAQIRQWLDDHGIPQADPVQWFNSTLPELVRANVSLGRLAPILVSSIVNDQSFSSPANVTEDVIIIAPGVPEIHTLRRMGIAIGTANIQSLRIYILAGPKQMTLWNDTGGPFTVGPYLGGDTAQTEQLSPLVRNLDIMGQNADFDNLQQQLHIEFVSAAPEVKTIEVDSLVDNYSFVDWVGPT